jgi:Translationally controlled tumour protein
MNLPQLLLLTRLAYMKAVKEKMKASGKDEAEIKEFETGAQAYAKKIVGGFKEYDFYVGESMDPDGMFVYAGALRF